MGVQMQQDFAMQQHKMKNERELNHPQLAMQQQILQLQQQMMNMFMMTLMGQNNLPDNEKSAVTITVMYKTIINLSDFDFFHN